MISREICMRQLQAALLVGAAVLNVSDVCAEPEIESVEGIVADQETLIVLGRGFTTKRHAKPLFWWTADGGDLPSSLGRMSDWADGFDGDDEVSTEVVSVGSRRAYRFDHGATESAALGRVDYDTGEFYMWRKKYDDFDTTKDYAVRTRILVESGELPEPGMAIRGANTGATGVVQSIKPSSHRSWNAIVFYDSHAGSIGDDTNIANDFVVGERLSWATGSGTNKEHAGTFRTFNFKTFRVWPTDEAGQRTAGSAVISAQATSGRFKWVVEGVTGTMEFVGISQEPREWQIEQVVYRDSSQVDLEDGFFWYSVGNQWLLTQDNIKTRTERYPYSKRQIYQSQVSNGAQPGSFAYYDSLYIDDSWHRVLISSHDRWTNASDVEVQIPSAWSDTRIEFSVRVGSLDSTGPLYLYVVDSDGHVNRNGHLVGCAECPQTMQISVD